MTRNHIFTIGCLGAIVLVIALVAIIYFSLRGPYELARSRWDEKGSDNYTLIVEQSSYRSLSGVFKITVQSGRVTDVEHVTDDASSPVGPSMRGLTPANFDNLTISAMLRRAQQDQNEMWKSPWILTRDITYDSTYGYVRSYFSDGNGKLTRQYIFHLDYFYQAHDLVITQP